MHNMIDRTARDLTAVNASGETRGKARKMLDRLHDETGAQAAEYAMLGGVSAAACGGLVVVFNTSDLIPALASTVMDILSTFMGSWF
jgi:Flp pilus assembly pilin Flp